MDDIEPSLSERVVSEGSSAAPARWQQCQETGNRGELNMREENINLKRPRAASNPDADTNEADIMLLCCLDNLCLLQREKGLKQR